MTKEEKGKLEWFALELRLKTIESMLGTKYTEALKVVLKSMYDEHKIVALAKELGVTGRSVLEKLEEIRKDVEMQEQVANRVEKKTPKVKKSTAN